jgi:high-affinity Fe2+/Pb2+ permease
MDHGHGAFVATTALLTFLPLGLLLGVAWWLRSRARRMGIEEGSHRSDD